MTTSLLELSRAILEDEPFQIDGLDLGQWEPVCTSNALSSQTSVTVDACNITVPQCVCCFSGAPPEPPPSPPDPSDALSLVGSPIWAGINPKNRS